MQLAIFGLQTAMSTVLSILIVKWYVWPALKRRDFITAFTPLLLFHVFRYMGMISLVPVVVQPEFTDTSFAVQQAFGDLIAATLALLALAAIRFKTSLGLGLLWIFNIWGSLELINAIFRAFADEIGDYNQFSFWFVPTVWVPTLLVTHAVMFVMLVKRSAEYKN